LKAPISPASLDFPEIADRLILLDGWSKTFAMTGWRLGYGVWPKPLVEHVSKLMTVDHSCVNGVAQMAGLAALTGPMDEVRKMAAIFAQRRALVVDGLNRLPGVSCRMPGGAFYAFPNIRGPGFPRATWRAGCSMKPMWRSFRAKVSATMARAFSGSRMRQAPPRSKRR
jgi:aspartate/methionine/tyrosine aminotransferase